MAFFSRQQDYRVISQNDESAELPSQRSDAEKESAKTIVASRSSRLPWCLTFIMLFINIVLVALLVPGILTSGVMIKNFSYLSARFDIVTRQMNGTLFPPADPSWSRVAPGAEADKLWDWYEGIRLVPLSKTDIVDMGKDPATTAQFTEDWDVPTGSYIGILDIYHKIHCLNELRKMTFEGWPGHGTVAGPRNHSELQWIHLRHCVDLIAQDLQCNANLDVIPYTWVDTQMYAYPDFSIPRTCTDWDQLREWSIKNTLNTEKFADIRRPADLLPIPAEDAYYEMYGFEDSVLYPGGKGYKGRT